MKYKVPFIKPSFPPEDDVITEYRHIVKSNWYTNFGPYENRFKKSIEDYIGNNVHAITFNNATIGLMAAIVALVGRGDNKKKIIIPSFTFVAGAQAIIWSGYQPSFIDIRRNTFQADHDAAETLINKNDVAAIMFCNTFGIGNPEIEKWEKLAKKYNKPLIIDSAAGFGSLYTDGSKVGSKGDCEVFSFHATKPFAIGEGGAIVTKDKSFADRLKKITNFGFTTDRDSDTIATNAKLQEINAAIGILQFKCFDKRLATRRLSYKLYEDGLTSVGFGVIPNANKSSLCFASFMCPEKINRDNLLDYLNSCGVQAKNYYNPPIHMQKYFNTNQKLETTEKVAKGIISLPIHDNMPKSLVNYTIDNITHYIEG